MADTLVLKIDLRDAEAALATLQNLDAAAAKLSKNPIRLPIAAGNSGSAASVAAATKQISGLGLAMKALPLKMVYDGTRLVKQGFREALSTIKEVDSELATIRKVTGMSTGELKELSKSAYDLATNYGRTADEVLNASTVFARAGYKDKIKELSELSILLQNVGDLEADHASKFLVATDAAYNLNGEYSALIKVVDGLNEITNRHATDMQVMTDGMTVAGSVFAESGESIETFAAMLGTASAATQRSGSEVARGLRTVLMNIRQIKGETEDGELVDGESIAKAAKALKEYAGISTMENGQLRLVSEVLDELAGKWENLGSVAQSAIAEALAGKRQSNILMALLDDWETVGKMVQEYADGAGSALAENQFYLESWEAKAKQLDATWTAFVANLVETDTIKEALDIVSGGLEAINAGFDTALEKSKAAHDEAAKQRREAEQSAQALAEQYAADYGAGSRYQELKADVEALTNAEKVELAILEARKKAREEELGIAEQTLEVAKQTEKTTLDNRGRDMLTGLQSSVQGISSVFVQTLNADLYVSQLQEVISSYADYVQALREAKDAGEELGESESRMIETFDLIARASVDGGNAVETYGKLVGAYVYAETGSWSDAAKAANSAMEQLYGGVENVPDEKTVTVDTPGADEALEKLKEVDAASADTTKTVTVEYASGGTDHEATGTKSAPGGPTLVNELGPELISANGLAWIAGGGKPTVTDLPRGAIVLTAQQTRRALSGNTSGVISAAADGLGIDTGTVEQAIAEIRQWFSGRRAEREAARAETVRETFGGYTPVSAASLSGADDWAREAALEEAQTTRRLLELARAEEEKAGGGSTGSGSGSGGGRGGKGAKPVDLKQSQKDLDAWLKNLKMQAELADNQGEHQKEGDLYGQAEGKIRQMIALYKAQGYADTADEVLTLENLIYDYADKQQKAYQHTWDAMEDALDDALKNINAQIDKAESENDVVKQMELYGEAQDKIAELLNAYLAAGYSATTDEVLRLTNLGYDYAGKQTKTRDKLFDDLIDALQDLKNSTDEVNDLAEKQAAVEEAQRAYNNASRQRTVRIFNPVTGQWEWVANAGDVQAAQERLLQAEKTLSDAQFDSEIRAAQRNRDASGLIAGDAVNALFSGAGMEQRQAVLTAMNAWSGVSGFSPTMEPVAANDSHNIGAVYNFNGIEITPDNPAYNSLKELASQLAVLSIA